MDDWPGTRVVPKFHRDFVSVIKVATCFTGVSSLCIRIIQHGYGARMYLVHVIATMLGELLHGFF